MKTKILIRSLIQAVVTLWVFAQALSAATFGKFTYNDYGTSVTITGYPPNGVGSVVIPAFIAHKPVAAIGETAFYRRTGVTSVTIPDSVTIIGDSAFFGCSSLTRVTLPSNLSSIGNSAFSGCSRLTNVIIPENAKEIGNYAFSGCIGLTSVTIPKNVTSLRQFVFSGCTGLTSVTIPSSLASIGKSAFSGCVSLKNLHIPNGVISIGRASFSGCTGLTGVTIPSSVTSINSDAFLGCSGLTSIRVDAGNLKYGSINGVLFDYKRTKILQFPAARIGTYILPGSVTSIGDHAFSGCAGLTDVPIPKTVTSIGVRAFSGCRSLTSLTIPDSLTDIGDRAFSGLSGLNSISIPSSVTSIGLYAFSGCSGLTTVTIPSSVTAIGDYAFSNCRSLTEVIFVGDAPYFVGRSIFRRCSRKLTVYYPDEAIGFTSPKWNGYLAVVGSPMIIVEQLVGIGIPNPGFRDCGKVKIGSNKFWTFTIRNAGTAILTGIAITQEGSDATDFVVTRFPSATVAPGDSTKFTLKFMPSASGSRNAAVSITSSDTTNNPFLINLTGMGIAPAAPLSLLNVKSSGLLVDALTNSSLGKSRVIVKSNPVDGLKYKTLIVEKAPGTAHLRRIVEVSPNLLDWFSGPLHTTVLRDDTSILRVRDNTPLTPGTKRHIRLRHTVP